jgi:hypothetical protein
MADQAADPNRHITFAEPADISGHDGGHSSGSDDEYQTAVEVCSVPACPQRDGHFIIPAWH